MKNNSRETIINALGKARMEPYLLASQDHRKNALSLYEWNIEMSASIQKTLGITEVFLRNAIDAQLQKWNNNELGSERSWLLEEPASPLRSLTQGKRKSALGRAQNAADRRHPTHPRHGQPITHDDVLAHTMFGMWKDLLPNHATNADPAKTENLNRERLWNEAIKNAFPCEDDPHGEKTYWRVVHLHSLRNRVSHMDSLLNIDILDYIQNSFQLLGSINPALRDWVTSTSTVRATYKKRPL